MLGIRRALRRVRRLVAPPDWARDLRDYYHVTTVEAQALGTRASGRRPSFPGSATAPAVRGRTFEELWDERPRTTESEIQAFYRDIGAWASFRQVYYHRYLDPSRFVEGMRPGGGFCEYGGGVGSIIRWIVERRRDAAYDLTLVDVPSEHLTFGEWRIRRLMERLRSPHRFEVVPVEPGVLPLRRAYDVIAILEVYEHLPNPLEVTEHLLGYLKPGGRLWENFVEHDHAHAADLQVAQQQRAAVLALLADRCTLIRGRTPTEDGSGTRCWQIRPAIGVH